jgi:3-oxoacyl-[acyl-carrier protein] reductase
MDLKNKNVIIAGAGRGIGKAIALALAAEGCNVALVSRNETELNEVCTEAHTFGV